MAYTREDVQVRLKNLGYYGGKIDGDLGPASCEAMMIALEALVALRDKSVVIEAKPFNPTILPPRDLPLVSSGSATRTLPTEWLQPATVSRIHLHWTAGGHVASENDKDHYHVLINGDGTVVKGNCDIAANSTTSPRGKKAHHTLNANTGSLAVSMACMLDAKERPFNGGRFPLTRQQWDKAIIVTAELCKRYNIPVTPKTVLSHAEVEANLGIKQRGKWDVAILPFDPQYDTARECGDLYRQKVQEHLRRLV
jgi:hypothetical protein